MGTSEEGELESWVCWLQRTTRHVEDQLQRANLDDWITTVRKRRQKLEIQMAAEMEMGILKWSHVLQAWKPGEAAMSYRRQGRPCLRWEDLRVR
eukprot:1125146-Karenia_brevis.AAC.1